jgi:CD2 antigen cytoplasmic tail-binding protein 2
MSKRKVQFAEGDILVDEELEKVFKGEKDSDQAKRFKEKHSLDSDEEDNADQYDVMEEDNIEGNIEANIPFQVIHTDTNTVLYMRHRQHMWVPLV